MAQENQSNNTVVATLRSHFFASAGLSDAHKIPA